MNLDFKKLIDMLKIRPYASARVILPNTPNEYDKERKLWNLSIDEKPAAIVVCTDKSDVENTVSWAGREKEKSGNEKLNLRVRSGGHNYEGYCMGGNNTVVIDISDLKEQPLSTQIPTVGTSKLPTIGSGFQNKDLYNLVTQVDIWSSFPGGTCPTVGVTGYTLGGGWGLSCRKFGLGCDSLEAVEMVIYDAIHREARIIKVDSSPIPHAINPDPQTRKDLFWACQGGGGGNFGVVTSLTYRLPSQKEVPEKITFISISGKNMTKAQQAEFLFQLQEILIDKEKYDSTIDWEKHINLGFVAGVNNSKDGELGVTARGLYYGTKKDAMERLQPILDSKILKGKIEVIPIEKSPREIFRDEFTAGPGQYFKSGARISSKKYTLEDINKLVNLIQTRPEYSIYIGLTFYALGGVVKYQKPTDTAFPHRNANFIIGLQTQWSEFDPLVKKNNINWFGEQFKKLIPLTTGGYVNFPTSELPNYMEDYYGEKNANRLWGIKQKIDKAGLFTFPQSISKPKTV